jgi:hypothetical protein
MAKSSLITAALVAASLSSPVQAYSGAALNSTCLNEDPNVSAIYGPACVAFVAGVDSGLAISGIPQPYCTSKAVGYKQMMLVVQKYLQEHPDQLHLRGGILVRDALIEAFPCKGE